MVKLVDTQDLKSCGPKGPCRFESDLGYKIYKFIINMRIKVDVDGVLRNLTPTMISLYNEKFGENITIKDISDYDVNISFPLLKKNNIDAFKFFFEDNAYIMFATTPAFENAAKALKKLIEHGHKVTIVTHQITTQNKILTLQWIDGHHIPYDSIAFTKKKYNIHGDILIDDNMDILNNEPNEVRKICISAPYNKDYKGEKYNSIMEAVDNILK